MARNDDRYREQFDPQYSRDRGGRQQGSGNRGQQGYGGGFRRGSESDESSQQQSYGSQGSEFANDYEGRGGGFGWQGGSQGEISDARMGSEFQGGGYQQGYRQGSGRGRSGYTDRDDNSWEQDRWSQGSMGERSGGGRGGAMQGSQRRNFGRPERDMGGRGSSERYGGGQHWGGQGGAHGMGGRQPWSEDQRMRGYGGWDFQPDSNMSQGFGSPDAWRGDEEGRWSAGQEAGQWHDPARSGWNTDGQSASRDTRGRFTGRGPKGYRRSDERIEEEINETLTRNGDIDASEITVKVSQGEVTLSGTVDDRREKRLVEDLAEQCSGVQQVQNNIRVGGNTSQQESRGMSTGNGEGREERSSRARSREGGAASEKSQQH